jgi:hypothetical protein
MFNLRKLKHSKCSEHPEYEGCPIHPFFRQNTLPDGQHSVVICDHLWRNGWQRGLYSDVEVRVR